jgi:putative transcriptional regulator
VRPDLVDLIPEYVLGTLPEAQMREIAALVDASPALQREVDRAAEALAASVETLPPLEPSPAVRSRLLDSLARAERFAPFFAQLERLLDLPVQAVRAVLARIDDAASWEPGMPGMELQHFEAGPRLSTADAGLVRLQPGASFPRHRHVGQELTFVLEGRMIDGGEIYGPGSLVERLADTVHDYSATTEQALLIVTCHHGIVPVRE